MHTYKKSQKQLTPRVFKKKTHPPISQKQQNIAHILRYKDPMKICGWIKTFKMEYNTIIHISNLSTTKTRRAIDALVSSTLTMMSPRNMAAGVNCLSCRHSLASTPHLEYNKPPLSIQNNCLICDDSDMNKLAHSNFFCFLR
jgi:hypothetical protein